MKYQVLSRENLISSHVKISLLLWLHDKLHLSHQKTIILSKMVWNFIGVYIINRTLHGCLEIWNFSSQVEKNISLVRCAHLWNVFQHSKRNFVCNVLYQGSKLSLCPVATGATTRLGFVAHGIFWLSKLLPQFKPRN